MNMQLMKKNLQKFAEQDAQVNASMKDMKEEYKKPNPLPAHKAPTGRGVSKGDILVQRLAVEFEYDPIKELIGLARNSKATPELQYKIATHLADYYLPKVKAIDVNPNQGEIISLNVVFPESK